MNTTTTDADTRTYTAAEVLSKCESNMPPWVRKYVGGPHEAPEHMLPLVRAVENWLSDGSQLRNISPANVSGLARALANVYVRRNPGSNDQLLSHMIVAPPKTNARAAQPRVARFRNTLLLTESSLYAHLVGRGGRNIQEARQRWPGATMRLEADARTVVIAADTQALADGAARFMRATLVRIARFRADHDAGEVLRLQQELAVEDERALAAQAERDRRETKIAEKKRRGGRAERQAQPQMQRRGNRAERWAQPRRCEQGRKAGVAGRACTD